MTKYNLRWLRDHALFGCSYESCAEAVSYPAGDLRMHNNEPMCEYCFDEIVFDGVDERLLFFNLPKFDPFAFIEGCDE